MTTKVQHPTCNTLEAAIDLFRHHASASGYVVEEVRLSEPSLKQPVSPRIVFSESTTPIPTFTGHVNKPFFPVIKQRRSERDSSKPMYPLPPLPPLPCPLTHHHYRVGGLKRTVSGGIIPKSFSFSALPESSKAPGTDKSGYEHVNDIADKKMTKKWCDEMHMRPTEHNALQHGMDRNYSPGVSSSPSLEDAQSMKVSAIRNHPFHNECLLNNLIPGAGCSSSSRMVRRSDESLSPKLRLATHGKGGTGCYTKMNPTGSSEPEKEHWHGSLLENEGQTYRSSFLAPPKIEARKGQDAVPIGHDLDRNPSQTVAKSSEKKTSTEPITKDIHSTKGHHQSSIHHTSMANNLSRVHHHQAPRKTPHQLNLRSRPMHEININTTCHSNHPVVSDFALDSHPNNSGGSTKKENHGLFAKSEVKEKDVIVTAVGSGLPVKKREVPKELARTFEQHPPKENKNMDWVRDIPDSHVHLFLSSVACIKARESEASVFKGDSEPGLVVTNKQEQEYEQREFDNKRFESDGKHLHPEMDGMEISPDTDSPTTEEVDESITSDQGIDKLPNEVDCQFSELTVNKQNSDRTAYRPSDEKFETAAPGPCDAPIVMNREDEPSKEISSGNSTHFNRSNRHSINNIDTHKPLEDGNTNGIRPMTRPRRDTGSLQRGLHAPGKANVCGEEKGLLGSSTGNTTKSIRPFKCRLCPSSFDRDGHLRVHILAVHEKKRPFVCQICNSSFGHSSSLLRHVRTVHQTAPQAADIIGTQLRSGRRQVSPSMAFLSSSSGMKGNRGSVGAGNKHNYHHSAGGSTGLKSIINKHERSNKSLRHAMGFEHRPFRCSVCSQTFAKVALLNRHVASKHPISSMRPHNSQAPPTNHSALKLDGEPENGGDDYDHRFHVDNDEIRVSVVAKSRKVKDLKKDRVMKLDNEDDEDDDDGDGDDKNTDEDYVYDS